MIDLYFRPTGNGKKTVILLEELGLPLHDQADQHRPWRPAHSRFFEDFSQRPDAGDR